MLQIVNYSEKAIAVIGDTKNIKEQLKELGGSFNTHLTCGAGWIFSAKKRSDVESLINGGSVPAENPVNEALKDMRVYVGTYAKYNSGSIAGKWLKLADYANKAEFLKACYEVHKDEEDPELMFQDYENVPSWMIGESHIDAEIWNLKPEKETGKQTTEQKRAILERCGVTCGLDYCAKNSALIVEIGGKCFDIPKQTIETDFCHPDEPEDAVRAFYQAVRTFEYFRNKNMRELERIIKNLQESAITNDLSGLFVSKQYNGTWRYGINAAHFYLHPDEKAEPMTEQIRQALIKGYKAVAKDFEKRLQTWWKRYGADKLHVWTYWADR